MSQSKTPTLPWAIPMYQQMQVSLHANLADSSLPPRMHRAVKKGLAKLGHYYSLAKLNHFNIIATCKRLQISLPKTFLMITEPTVCHLALHLSWFGSIDDDSYDHAKEVFEYHLQEYQATAPEPAQPQSGSDRPAESNSFLVSIAHHRHSLPQPHLNLHRSSRGMLSLSTEFRNVTRSRTLCFGGR